MCFASRDHHASAVDGQVPAEEQRQEFVARAMRFGCVLTVCVFVWLLSGAGYFWPGWVLLIGGLSLGKAAREAYGPGSGDPAEVDAYSA